MSENSEEEYARLLNKTSTSDLIRTYCDVFKTFIALIRDLGKVQKSNPTAYEVVKRSDKYPNLFYEKLVREMPVAKTGAMFTLIFRIARLGREVVYMSAEEREKLLQELEEYVRMIEEEE
jgi:hypothetical protein